MKSIAKTFPERLRHYVDACYPAVYVNSHEEARVAADIFKHFAKKPDKATGDPGCRVYEWDSQVGLYERVDEDKTKNIKDSEDPLKMFAHIKALCASDEAEAIYIIKDFHLQFELPLKKIAYIRAFKNILGFLKSRRNMIIFLSPVTKIPLELTKDIQFVDFNLPDDVAIESLLDFIADSVNEEREAKNKLTISDEVKEQTIHACRGLTAGEIESALSFAIVENKQFNQGFVKSVFSEKIQQVKKGGLLTHLDTNITFDNVGGLDLIKDWIRTRKHAFSKKAKEFGLPTPKGLGLAGIAGCGKTLLSKSIANAFGFPLFQLDLGGLFSKYVGETEGNFIQMMKTVEAIGECVILID
jgi:hypothetical protein